jgi:hypothetical protein
MKYEVSDIEKRLQTVIVMVFSSGKKIRDDYNTSSRQMSC